MRWTVDWFCGLVYSLLVLPLLLLLLLLLQLPRLYVQTLAATRKYRHHFLRSSVCLMSCMALRENWERYFILWLPLAFLASNLPVTTRCCTLLFLMKWPNIFSSRSLLFSYLSRELIVVPLVAQSFRCSFFSANWASSFDGNTTSRRLWFYFPIVLLQSNFPSYTTRSVECRFSGLHIWFSGQHSCYLKKTASE